MESGNVWYPEKVTLTYTGGKGKSELGMSFRLLVLNIYRTTDKGSPNFDEDNRFAKDGTGSATKGHLPCLSETPQTTTGPSREPFRVSPLEAVAYLFSYCVQQNVTGSLKAAVPTLLPPVGAHSGPQFEMSALL
jgi:hypothetical protein